MLKRKPLGSKRNLKCRNRGFTLIEILVSIAIIVVLVGLLIPVLGRAKLQAKRANDLSQLHQLGLAGALYAENDGPYFPRACALLVNTGLAQKELCSGLSDPTTKGIASRVGASFGSQPLGDDGEMEPFRSTFVGTWEFRSSDFLELSPYEGRSLDQGWLVDLSPVTFDWSEIFNMLQPEGSFIRLRRDSSIQRKPMSTVKCVVDGQRIATSLFFFCDLDTTDRAKVCRPPL